MPGSDHVLSFVSSYMSTRSLSAAQRPAPPLALSGSSGSGPIELRTKARLWEVQWDELTIVRLIGHGSFGSVYLAEWNQTQVAAKVLVGKGEHGPAPETQFIAGCAARATGQLSRRAEPQCVLLPRNQLLQTTSTAASLSCQTKWRAICTLRRRC